MHIDYYLGLRHTAGRCGAVADVGCHFLPRDAKHSLAQLLSVCQYITIRYYVKTAKRIVEILVPADIALSLRFFLSQNYKRRCTSQYNSLGMMLCGHRTLTSRNLWTSAYYHGDQS